MKAPEAPLEFDILYQDECTIKELRLRVESLAYELRDQANITRMQLQQSEDLLKSQLATKLDYLAAAERKKLV